MAQIAAIFVSVFIAELGDKTQLATLLFATDKALSPFLVFLAATAALTLSSALAVLAGSFAGDYLANLPLKLIAGGGFILIGLWNVFEHFKA